MRNFDYKDNIAVYCHSFGGNYRLFLALCLVAQRWRGLVAVAGCCKPRPVRLVVEPSPSCQRSGICRLRRGVCGNRLGLATSGRWGEIVNYRLDWGRCRLAWHGDHRGGMAFVRRSINVFSEVSCAFFLGLLVLVATSRLRSISQPLFIISH